MIENAQIVTNYHKKLNQQLRIFDICPNKMPSVGINFEKSLKYTELQI